MITESPQVFYQHLTAKTPIVAIDYGRKKIGIAVSDQDWRFALPLATETVVRNDHISIIEHYLSKYKTKYLVIGLPLNMDGSESEQTLGIKRFTEALHKHNPELTILLQDERLTSKTADSLLRLGGISRQERQSNDDSVAASLILESALLRLTK